MPNRVSCNKRTVSKRKPKRKCVAKKRPLVVRTYKRGPNSTIAGRSCNKNVNRKKKTKAGAAPRKKNLKSKPRSTATRKCAAKPRSTATRKCAAKPKRAPRQKRCLNASATAPAPDPGPAAGPAAAPPSLPQGNEPEVARLAASPGTRRRITRRPVARPRNLREPDSDSVIFIPSRTDEAPAKRLKTKVTKKVVGGRTTAKPKPKPYASGVMRRVVANAKAKAKAPDATALRKAKTQQKREDPIVRIEPQVRQSDDDSDSGGDQALRFRRWDNGTRKTNKAVRKPARP